MMNFKEKKYEFIKIEEKMKMKAKQFQCNK